VIAMTFGYTDIPASDLGADVVLDRYDQVAGAIARLAKA
jgi:hypothetical protein